MDKIRVQLNMRFMFSYFELRGKQGRSLHGPATVIGEFVFQDICHPLVKTGKDEARALNHKSGDLHEIVFLFRRGTDEEDSVCQRIRAAGCSRSFLFPQP